MSRSGSTSMISMVCFISKPMSFMVETYVVPTSSTGPLKSENPARGLKSVQFDVSR